MILTVGYCGTDAKNQQRNSVGHLRCNSNLLIKAAHNLKKIRIIEKFDGNHCYGQATSIVALVAITVLLLAVNRKAGYGSESSRQDGYCTPIQARAPSIIDLPGRFQLC